MFDTQLFSVLQYNGGGYDRERVVNVSVVESLVLQLLPERPKIVSAVNPPSIREEGGVPFVESH